MAQLKLSGPVGISRRESQGAKVRNAAKDIVLVRKMLNANKIGPMGDSCKMDPGLLKAIKAYQTKIGIKTPDLVIDPGGRTLTALKPKYQVAVAEEAKIVMVEIRHGGERLRLTQKDHQKMIDDVFKRLGSLVKSLLSNHKFCLETHQDYLDTAMMRDGLFQAVMHAVIVTTGSVKMPDIKIVTRSISATGALDRAVRKKDIAALNVALPEAEAAINAFNAEIRRFLKDFVGSAQTTVSVLKVTSAVSFAVVGALAAPVLVTGLGISASAAAVTSSASVAIIQSTSQELGKHAGGQKVTVWESVKAVTIDGAVGALTAGIASKLPLGFVDKAAKSLASKLGSKVTFLAGKPMEKFLSDYLRGTGKSTVTSAVNEAINLIGTAVKKGKFPSEKDFDAAVESYLMNVLLSGPMKSLGGFQKKWAYQNKTTLEGTILPVRFAKLAKDNNIPNVLKAKLWADVVNKVSKQGLKAGFEGVINFATGTESEKQLSDIAIRELSKDKALQTIVDREMLKAMKKYGIKAK